MENRLGLVNDPLVFLHHASGETYEVEVIQQVQINSQFDYLIDAQSVESVICDRIDSWTSPVDLFRFTFFNFSNGPACGDSYFELNGYCVAIKRYANPFEIANQENQILDFNAFLNQNPSIDDGSGGY